MDASCSGNPEALSLFNTSVAGPIYDSGTFTSPLNGTNSSVIHSPCAVAYVCTRIFPSLSKTSIGNEASKNHTPRALPMTLNSLTVTAPGNRRVNHNKTLKHHIF